MKEIYVVFEYTPTGVEFHNSYADKYKAYERARDSIKLNVRCINLIE